MQSNFEKWVSGGGDPTAFFEIVGGGHPSQLAHELDAEAIWNYIEQNIPGKYKFQELHFFLICTAEALGEINPNNDFIQQKFGNQGGY
jgi:hypothetical protein